MIEGDYAGAEAVLTEMEEVGIVPDNRTLEGLEVCEHVLIKRRMHGARLSTRNCTLRMYWDQHI
jgi:hypothetical protein